MACALMSILTLAREMMPDPPAALEAVVDDMRVGPRLPYGEYRQPGWDRAPDHMRPPGTHDRPRLGVVVTFDVIARGLRDQVLDVCWTLYAVDVGRHALVRRLDDGCTRLGRPEANVERLSSEVWVPLPTLTGRYVVHVGVYQHAQRLDLAYTRAFSGWRAR
jgi:hypothetical protein